MLQFSGPTQRQTPGRVSTHASQRLSQASKTINFGADMVGDIAMSAKDDERRKTAEAKRIADKEAAVQSRQREQELNKKQSYANKVLAKNADAYVQQAMTPEAWEEWKANGGTDPDEYISQISDDLVERFPDGDENILGSAAEQYREFFTNSVKEYDINKQATVAVKSVITSFNDTFINGTEQQKAGILDQISQAKKDAEDVPVALTALEAYEETFAESYARDLMAVGRTSDAKSVMTKANLSPDKVRRINSVKHTADKATFKTASNALDRLISGHNISKEEQESISLALVSGDPTFTKKHNSYIVTQAYDFESYFYDMQDDISSDNVIDRFDKELDGNIDKNIISKHIARMEQEYIDLSRDSNLGPAMSIVDNDPTLANKSAEEKHYIAMGMTTGTIRHGNSYNNTTGQPAFLNAISGTTNMTDKVAMVRQFRELNPSTSYDKGVAQYYNNLTDKEREELSGAHAFAIMSLSRDTIDASTSSISLACDDNIMNDLYSANVIFKSDNGEKGPSIYKSRSSFMKSNTDIVSLHESIQDSLITTYGAQTAGNIADRMVDLVYYNSTEGLMELPDAIASTDRIFKQHFSTTTWEAAAFDSVTSDIGFMDLALDTVRDGVRKAIDSSPLGRATRLTTDSEVSDILPKLDPLSGIANKIAAHGLYAIGVDDPYHATVSSMNKRKTIAIPRSSLPTKYQDYVSRLLDMKAAGNFSSIEEFDARLQEGVAALLRPLPSMSNIKTIQLLDKSYGMGDTYFSNFNNTSPRIPYEELDLAAQPEIQRDLQREYGDIKNQHDLNYLIIQDHGVLSIESVDGIPSFVMRISAISIDPNVGGQVENPANSRVVRTKDGKPWSIPVEPTLDTMFKHTDKPGRIGRRVGRAVYETLGPDGK